MKHQLAIQNLLQTRFAEAKAKNPSFSLRAFARKTGLSHAMVSRVLAGKRHVSPKLARKITRSLMLDPQEASELLSLFPENKKTTSSHDSIDPNYLQLTADHFKMISEWHYFAILSLLKTKGFMNDASWIGERLGLPEATIKQAIERLMRLEILTQDEKGNLRRAAPRFRTSDDVSNLSLRKAHFTNLELARLSLESDPVHARDFTSLTLAFRASRIDEAKIEIRKFQDEFDRKFESDESDPDEVYRLFVSLFPMTKPSTRPAFRKEKP
jgi:uncharacterized protein (TIGR02147 family)